MLNTLKDTSRGHKSRRRVGRGMGSGHGKTSGRGQKGQGARSGYKRRYGKEGGQFPLYLKLPTRGFNNARFRTEYHTINLGQLQAMVDVGILTTKDTINEATLRRIGYISGKTQGIKLLGDGELKTAFNVEVTAASTGARDGLQNAGGKLTIVEPKKGKAAAE